MPTHAVHGALTYVRPAFMLPAVGMSAFGGLLAPSVDPLAAALHASAVSLALYIAHLNDGYIDAHVRGEEAPVMTARANRTAVGGTTLLLLAALVALWMIAGPLAMVVTVPLWVLAVLHAPYLDTNPVTVTIDYPVGIGFAILGGHLAQADGLPASVAAIAVVFIVLLSGVKLSVDRLDRDFDRSIDKRTVPVILGDRAAAVISAVVLAFVSVLVTGLVAVGVFPPAAVLASAFPLVAAAVGLRTSKEVTVRLQMLLTYPFAAVLFVSCCSALSCGFGATLTAVHFLGLSSTVPVEMAAPSSLTYPDIESVVAQFLSESRMTPG